MNKELLEKLGFKKYEYENNSYGKEYELNCHIWIDKEKINVEYPSHEPFIDLTDKEQFIKKLALIDKVVKEINEDLRKIAA